MGPTPTAPDGTLPSEPEDPEDPKRQSDPNPDPERKERCCGCSALPWFRAVDCGLACIDCARITNHRVLFALTGFIISYTVLVYCILDLVWVNRMPYWATLSTVTFIVGLWAPSPGQGLATSKPAKQLRERFQSMRR